MVLSNILLFLACACVLVPRFVHMNQTAHACLTFLQTFETVRSAAMPRLPLDGRLQWCHAAYSPGYFRTGCTQTAVASALRNGSKSKCSILGLGTWSAINIGSIFVFSVFAAWRLLKTPSVVEATVHVPLHAFHCILRHRVGFLLKTRQRLVMTHCFARYLIAKHTAAHAAVLPMRGQNTVIFVMDYTDDGTTDPATLAVLETLKTSSGGGRSSSPKTEEILDGHGHWHHVE
jgi:hypothetical protein